MLPGSSDEHLPFHQCSIQQDYADRMAELERERNTIELEKEQVHIMHLPFTLDEWREGWRGGE